MFTAVQLAGILGEHHVKLVPDIAVSGEVSIGRGDDCTIPIKDGSASRRHALITLDGDGFRLLPDGRSATIIVEHPGEATEEADVLTLVEDHYKKVGLKLVHRKQDTNNFRLRVFSGEAIMTAYAGYTTAVPTADASPGEFCPTQQGGLQWSRWGMFVQSNGKQGEKCDFQPVVQLLDLYRQWQKAPDEAARRKAWDQILSINVDQVFSIGTVNNVLQPIVVGPHLRNVPKEGYWAWDPGGYIGLYKPDTFWLTQ